MWIRQWPEQDGVNQREDRGIDAYAQCKSEDCRKRKAGRLAKLPECKSKIGQHRSARGQKSISRGYESICHSIHGANNSLKSKASMCSRGRPGVHSRNEVFGNEQFPPETRIHLVVNIFPN